MKDAHTIVDHIQQRVEEIETEAARLIVFANTTPVAALSSNLERIANTLMKDATEMEKLLCELSVALLVNRGIAE